MKMMIFLLGLAFLCLPLALGDSPSLIKDSLSSIATASIPYPHIDMCDKDNAFYVLDGALSLGRRLGEIEVYGIFFLNDTNPLCWGSTED